MTYYNGSLSDQDKKDIYEDACAAYQAGSISLVEFSAKLASIGYNATDIADVEKFYRPQPQESEDEGDLS